MSDEETQADIDFLAAYYSSPVSYQCDFCSYDGISLFSFNLDHGKKPNESKAYIKDTQATVNKKYYEPPYCEDGKKYNFVGWSTTKGDTASNAKEFNNLPVVYGEQSYYAIVDFTTSTPVFVEILGTEPNGHYQILSYDDALSSNYFKVDGNELLSFYENSVMKTNPYSSNQVPYKLFISDSRIKTLGTNSLSSITSGSIRALSISSVETIKENAFQLFNNDSDTAITVEGKNVTSIASKAFYSAGKIKYVSLPKISVIPESCFEAAKIVEAHLNSDSLTKISKKAFYGCSELKKIYIGKNVNTIEYYTDTSGAVLSPFSDTTYNSCKVDELTVNSSNTTFKSSQNALIRKSDQALIFATNSTLTIPSDVKIIAAYSFAGLNNMSDKTVTIPSSVTRIEASAFYRSAVNKIVFNGTKSTFKSICSRDFYNCTSTLQQELRFDFTDATNQTLSNVFN